MSTSFSSFDSSSKRTGQAATSFRELGHLLMQVLSASLAEGWQATCRRSAEARGASVAQGWQALWRRSTEARDDARFLSMAERDPRVMHELQAALSRRGD